MKKGDHYGKKAIGQFWGKPACERCGGATAKGTQWAEKKTAKKNL